MTGALGLGLIVFRVYGVWVKGLFGSWGLGLMLRRLLFGRWAGALNPNSELYL